MGDADLSSTVIVFAANDVRKTAAYYHDVWDFESSTIATQTSRSPPSIEMRSKSSMAVAGGRVRQGGHLRLSYGEILVQNMR
jgi:hypothetical protein